MDAGVKWPLGIEQEIFTLIKRSLLLFFNIDEREHFSSPRTA